MYFHCKAENAQRTQSNAISCMTPSNASTNIYSNILAPNESIQVNDQQQQTMQKLAFVPYRDSLLTYLLKDSLGGNSKTYMIASIIIIEKFKANSACQSLTLLFFYNFKRH
jgi:protein tyrosine phosphatase